MKSYTILVLSFALIIKFVLGGVCPPASHIHPCICSNITLECTSDQDFDLDMVFQAITRGKQPNSEDLAFETFILNSSKIRKLEDNTLKGVTFETIKLQDCQQLTCVSPSAFSDLRKNLTSFISIGTSFKSQEKDCNIFDALKMLYNLETIIIRKSQISEIPENAFEGKMYALSALKTIDLSGGQGGHITKVGKMAFSTLKSLEYIDLSYHKIRSIDLFGFQFMDPISHKLVIDLTHNNLTENSFGVEAFEVNQRVTELRLMANTRLKVLSETVFEPFLINRANETYDNSIDLRGTPLNCSPGNVWLLKMKSPLKLDDKLKNVLSTEGESFWQLTTSQCSNAKSVLPKF